MNSDLRAAAIRRNIADDIRVRNAAWDMLAALKRVRGVAEDALCDAAQAGERDNAAVAREALTMVDAAIAKAEGRPNG
ncbi:hypothetical protein V5F34_08555 [Xanthobacter autotrophicus]|uniref:hypothetical protein n=1 Tax=Xanthobacter autotrophicus TaxID=280 RepID=UPI00372C0F20